MKPLTPLFPPLRARDGRQTRELVMEPGKFGLGQLPSRLAPDQVVNAVCGFCSTGCNLTIHLRDGKPVNLTAAEYPVNLGMACPKGWEALTPLAAPDRATVPLLRDRETSKTTLLDWGQAAAQFCERFKAIQAEHGKQSVAFISTGQICTEEMTFLGAFAKFGMGIQHGDGNTRQCMATAATAYRQSFGFDAPPFSYADFEESDVLVFVGANPCIAHPIMWQRVMRNKRKPEIIVIDPRKTETAMSATRHVQLRAKSDLPLLYALAGELVRNGWVDQDYLEAHTNDYAAFAEFAKAFTLAHAAEATGIDEARLQELAGLLKPGRRVSYWWTMGVNQGHEATRTAQAIINLALIGGHIGKPGTGANSITGQCNAMGSRLYSNTTSLIGGHNFANPEHRAKVAGILNLPLENIPTEGSWAYDQIVDGIETGHIKGLWIIATNPAHSWMKQNRMRELLGKLDFLVVQDMYHSTETAQHADLLLPAAGWGEKEGTFINSERRFGLVQRVAVAPGLALSDFNIFRLLSEAWGCGGMFRNWRKPEDVFQSMKAISKGQPCDISGITDYAMLHRCGGVQWPCPEGTSEAEAATERRLFADGQFPHQDGRAKFLFSPPWPVPEPTDAIYPLILLTGRGTSAQWHTETRTGKSAILRKLHTAGPYMEVNAVDAAAAGIADQSMAWVESRRAKIQVKAVVCPSVSPGEIFIPMHDAQTNQLTVNFVDPHSRQPAYKHCAVRISRSD